MDSEEETSWMNEKIVLLMALELPNTLAALQSLLKKHEAFETVLAVYQDRIADVNKQGRQLIDQVIFCIPCLIIRINGSVMAILSVWQYLLPA